MAVFDSLSVQYLYMDAPVQTAHTEELVNPNPQPKKDNQWITIVSVGFFILLSLGAVIFLYNQNQQLKAKLANYQATPTPVATQTPIANPNLPVISSPSAGAKIVSPLKITGTVPPGWMFEGVFPIKIVDSKEKVLAQGQAKEKVAGSWQSGNPVDFEASLTFKNSSGTGTLVLENDNPSGLPENLKTFEVPVIF
jgi:hypothetical protein